MVEELDVKTYLWISSNEFRIYLFNKKNLKNLYLDQIKFDNKENYIDFQRLDKFLADNIFKIEKLAGNFIKNISLLIKNNKTNQINFGIKKKNYEKFINKKLLENILIDAKDLFRENYQNHLIMHILISRYFENNRYHLSFSEEFSGDYLCAEVEFKYISRNFIFEVNKVLRKYEVELTDCLDVNYIENYFAGEDIEYPETVYKIQSGINENEVKLINKNYKKKGFFEKFFQLFG